MAEVAVDERKLLKTMRWWDGLIIGLANPGFLLVGLAFSLLALGGLWATIIWIISAVIGALQAYIYAEPAAMFPDKPGGLSVYAREGWRKHFTLAGPIAVFGYWFAWSSVLAIYGAFVGLLLIREFGGSPESYWNTESWDAPVLTSNVTWPILIGVMCILLCYVFNVRGMRPAVWFSYVVGGLMIIPVGAIAIGGFLTGDFSNHQIATEPGILGATTQFYEDSGSGFDKFALMMVWLYIIGWSTYGPEAAATFAPEYKDTKNDTRMALATTGGLNVLLAILLPIVVIGTVGLGGIDATGVVYLVDVLHAIAGDGFGAFLTVCLCAGLLLSMNTATMDGSRALYALSEEKMTVKWLGVLNKHHVPGRAMTVDMLLNIFLLLYFGNIFFILAAGNLGYILSHVLALSGVLLLRRDRPNWPRPIRLGRPWMWAAGFFALANLLFIIFGLIKIKYTGYLFNSDFSDATAKLPEMLAVALGSLAAGVVGYIVAQRQHGLPFKLRDNSEEAPSQEAIDGAAAAAAVRAK